MEHPEHPIRGRPSCSQNQQCPPYRSLTEESWPQASLGHVPRMKCWGGGMSQKGHLMINAHPQTLPHSGPLSQPGWTAHLLNIPAHSCLCTLAHTNFLTHLEGHPGSSPATCPKCPPHTRCCYLHLAGWLDPNHLSHPQRMPGLQLDQSLSVGECPVVFTTSSQV